MAACASEFAPACFVAMDSSPEVNICQNLDASISSGRARFRPRLLDLDVETSSQPEVAKNDVHDRVWFRHGSLNIDTDDSPRESRPRPFANLECLPVECLCETPSTLLPNSPRSSGSRALSLTCSNEASPASANDIRRFTCPESRPAWGLTLDSPTSSSTVSFENSWAVDAEEVPRSNFDMISGNVSVIFFDFDGTLTSTPGDVAKRWGKQADLQRRSPMLAPHLRALRDAGMSLGIISKSTEYTIRSALEAASLSEFFDGPIIAKAIGFEGKAGFIKDLISDGNLSHTGAAGVGSVLLVDDDVSELERASEEGIQTFPAPVDGGLQDQDFNSILCGLGLS